MIYAYEGKRPRAAGDRVFVAPGADIIGDVVLGADASIWFNATLRGDIEPITVGEGSNVQDGSSVHTDKGYPAVIGKGVTVGHNCVIHGCEIGDGSLVGMGAVVLTGAKVGRDCLIGAGALVTGGTVIPDGSLALGSPAKVVKGLGPGTIAEIRANGENYVARKDSYLASGVGAFEGD